jgi:hypothetical protein
MHRRILVFSFCLLVGIFFSVQAFSQDEPVNTEDRVVDEAKDEKSDTDESAMTEKTEMETKESKAGKVYTSVDSMFANTKVKFLLKSIDNISMGEIFYKMDGGEAQKYEGPFTIEEEGKHTITYYGVDLNNNTEIEKTFEVIIDATGPEVTLETTHPLFKTGEVVYFTNSNKFSIEAEDKLSGVHRIGYTVSGENTRVYASPFSVKTDDSVELTVQAVDNVSNKSNEFAVTTVDKEGTETTSTVTSLQLTADNTAPTVTITPDKELKESDLTPVAKTDVKYTLSAEDQGSGVNSIYYRIDGKGKFVPYTSPISFTTNGEHVIEAQAVDNVGNISNVTILKVVVDTIPPETTIEAVTE